MPTTYVDPFGLDKLIHGLPAGYDTRVGDGANNELPTGTKQAIAILAVTGESRVVCHQRITGTRQAVEQGGLAYIGPSNKCDNRQHDFFIAVQNNAAGSNHYGLFERVGTQLA